MQLPDDAAINAKAVELGHTLPLDRTTRREVINMLLQPTEPEMPATTVLSRTQVQVADGYLVIEVTHHPS